MSLLEMNGNLGQINGGLGFSVSYPESRTTVTRSKRSSSVVSVDNNEDISDFLRKTANRIRFQRNLPPSRIEISSFLPVHQGFGSFTSTALAVVEGLLVQSGQAFTTNEIISLSRRGGTSGVGINSYFHGGLTVDIGHPVSENKKKDDLFVPSSFSWNRGPAIPLVQMSFPKWPLLLILPRTRPLSEVEERNFFRKICPLSVHEVADTIRLCFFGIVPAVKTRDYVKFCKIVRLLRETAWKRAEINLYRNKVTTIIQRAEQLGADAASMSSLGPLIYCFAKPNRLVGISERLEREFDITMACITEPRNRGRNITVEE